MSFSSSLDYFESMLLPGLTSQGAAEVTIIADANAYKACFSELGAVSGPGISYRFAPVRFAIPRGCFHPKLYLLASASQSILVVTSANLSLFGFRANAEIAEVLRLDNTGAGDRDAFESYADLLDYLTEVGLGLPLAIIEETTNHANRLRETLALSPSAGSSGARLIHSARRSLLDQLIEIVEPVGVSKITAVAPFFDPGSRGIRALLKAFPNARMRIIKRPASSDFDGSALSLYSKRIVVDHLLSLGKKARSLHAKIYLMECVNGDVWSVSGSPNMTAAAWSFKAGPVGEHVGNLEAAVVRKIERRDVRELLGELRLERVEWKRFTYEDSSVTELDGKPLEIPLIEAAVAGYRLVIRAIPGEWCSDSAKRSVILEDRGSRITVIPIRVARSATEFVLECQSDHPLFQADTPALVTLRIVDGDRIFEGRVWLTRPLLLASTSRERKIRNAVAALNIQRFPPRSDLFIYVQAIEEILTAVVVADLSTEAEGGPSPLDGTNGSTRGDDSGVSTVPKSGSGDGGNLDPTLPPAERFQLLTATNRLKSETISQFAQVMGALDRLLMAPPDEVLEDEVLEQKRREKSGPLTDAPPSKQPRELRVGMLSGRDVRELAAALERVCELLKDRAATPDMLPLAVPLFEKIVSVLVRVVVQTDRDNGEAATTLKRVVATLWKDALSQDGIFDGTPRGWLIRPWLTESGRNGVVQAIGSDGERSAKLTVLLGVSLSILGEADDSESQLAQSLVAGWQLIARQSNLQAYLDASNYATEVLNNFVTNSFGLTSVGQITRALRPVDPTTLPFIKLTSRWAPLLHLVRAEQLGEDTAALLTRLREVSPDLASAYTRIRVRPRATLIDFRGNLAICGACNTSQPAERTLRLRSAEECVYCDNCQRLLITYDFHSPFAIALSQQLLAHMQESELSVARTPNEVEAASI